MPLLSLRTSFRQLVLGLAWCTLDAVTQAAPSRGVVAQLYPPCTPHESRQRYLSISILFAFWSLSVTFPVGKACSMPLSQSLPARNPFTQPGRR